MHAILWTVHARVLKFHLWILHEKIADPYFFLSELCPFLELCPFEKIRKKSCQQDILKSIWARGLKLGQLIGDEEYINFWTKSIIFFQELCPFANLEPFLGYC